MLDQTSLETLHRALEAIRSITHDNNQMCEIDYESHPSESIISGTQLSFLRLAVACIECALPKANMGPDSDFERVEISGISATSTDILTNVFSDSGDVWPVCAIIADTEADVVALRTGLSRSS